MASDSSTGYMGKILRVDLTNEKITEEKLPEALIRKYLGGAGLAARLLYNEVLPGVEWSDPANRLIFATGPLTGTNINGSGGFVVVTKGSLTNGLASAQANGFFGAYLKFCGYDVIIVQGAAKALRYLHIYEGGAEIRKADHLAGKDTWETERLIKEELGKTGRAMSVSSIGPAGENLVRFACLVGDEGHVAAHNGAGAVSGAKKLKAIAVERGKGKVNVADKEKVSQLNRALSEKRTAADASQHHVWGTLGSKKRAEGRLAPGYLPIKNLSTNLWNYGEMLCAEDLMSRPQFKFRRNPCWACQFHHCHLISIEEGTYAGYEGEEPEYEPAAGFGPLIDNHDWPGIVVLSNEADRLGMDANESAWLIAWLMECYDRGLIDKETTCGLPLQWGNVEATRELLHKIARREGCADVLAEGVMRAAQHINGEAQNLAVYTAKGNTPRMHDHRCSWPMLLDTVTSDRGRDEHGALILRAEAAGLPPGTDLFTPDATVAAVEKVRGRILLIDSLVLCKFQNIGWTWQDMSEIVSAVTGWSFTENEAKQLGLRITNLFHAFNVRHGHTRELDFPSPRYSSAPVDGPNQGKSILPVWHDILDKFYSSMGWDKDTGKPLPDTLTNLGLEDVVPDIWT
ncbi:aldehyde ferredoxin oxidoreductase family protein [Chloroflexota bacterium]